MFENILVATDLISSIDASVATAARLELLNAADMTRADLIVMGSHTKATAGKWYPGSVVERASYRPSCPVMVITDPDAVMPWDSPELSGDRKHRDRFIHVFTHPGIPPS